MIEIFYELKDFLKKLHLNDNECRIKDLAMEETQSKGGGAVSAVGANFRNNRFSIILNAYPNQTDYSEIRTCSLYVDEPIHDYDAVNGFGYGLSTNSFVKLYDVHGIVMDHNDFNVDYSLDFEYDEKGIGVGAFDSDFELTQNNFHYLTKGFAAGASNSLNTFVAKCNAMENVVYGMDIRGIDYPIVKGNSISVVPAFAPPYAYGIYLENCNGYELRTNGLSYAGSLPWDWQNSGIVDYFSSSNSNDNEIQDNTISNFYVASNLEGNLASNSDATKGLKMWFNNFSNYEYAMTTTLAPGIAGYQDGGPIGYADNLFDGCNSSNEGELHNPVGMNPYTYFHDLDNSPYIVEPVSGCFTSTSSQVILSPSSNQFDINNFNFDAIDCEPSHRNIHRTLLTDQHFQARSAHDTIINDDNYSLNEQIRHFLHDSIPNAMDSIINLLNNSNLPDRKYLLASAYAKAGRDSLMHATIDDMNSDTTYSTMASVFYLMDTMSSREISANNSIRETLTNLALDSTKYGNTAARILLTALYESKFPEVILFPDSSSPIRKVQSKENVTHFDLYPNPFTDELTIDFHTIDERFTILIYDLMGKQIKKIITSGKNIFKLNTEDFSEGLFIVNVYNDKNDMSSYKISHISK
jgi:hypothetical protein